MAMDVWMALAHRFGTAPAAPQGVSAVPPVWEMLATRGACRAFTADPVSPAVIDTLCGLSLCAPSKSDLQQRDIVIMEDPVRRGRLNDLLREQDWIAGAPHFLVFCGNNRRQRQLHGWRGHPFANDHLDPFFNAAVDAGIALATFIVAAEAAGLGCCPVSIVRNEAQAVSDLLELPEHVFPVAGLGLGYPARPPTASLKLPLGHTVHRDRFREDGIREAVDAYDSRRAAVAPYSAMRMPDVFGSGVNYGWSEDKARQYAVSERADFGAFVRRRGFRLD